MNKLDRYFVIPRRGLSSIFVRIHMPDPYKIEIIKNVNTNIIINPLYLDHPEDLAILAHITNERPWDILCMDAYAKRGKK